MERLALGKLHGRPRPGLGDMLTKAAEPAVVIDHVVPNPEPDTSYYFGIWACASIEIVKPIVERSSGLRYLVLKAYHGSWIDLLQLLLDNCPDLETIDLSGFGIYFNEPKTASNGIVQVNKTFAALKEFRMSGAMTEQTYQAVARMVVRSAATLEVVWINRNNWEQAGEGANPFHIGSAMSWTQCTRLKEPGIYGDRGLQMTDYRWDVSPSFSIWEPIKDYSTVFGQLERLQLAVREALWGQCPDQSNIEPDGEEDGDLCGNSDLDEQDDENWKPLKAATPTEEEKIRECQPQQVERNHQRAFIFQVREFFGRLKDLQQLREPEIDWIVCSGISEMSLEHALELFRETEVNESNNNGGYERTSKGWWGKVNQEDLVWLCLPWLSQPNIQPSIVPSHLIKATARQYENKTPLPAGSHDFPDCSNERPPWGTCGIYNGHVGRQWKDWDDINQGCHPYAGACRRCSGSTLSCFWNGVGHNDTYTMESVSHVVHSRDFEIFVEGLVGNEEPVWGRNMATRGDRGRYRQKAVGKMNQSK